MRTTLEGDAPFTRLAFQAQSDLPRKQVVDTRGLVFVSPLELVGIAALLADGKTHRRRQRLIMPIDHAACTYMERMNLVTVAEELGVAVESVRTAGPRRRTKDLVELQQVRTDEEAAAVAQQVHALVARSSTDQDAARSVEMVGELIDNALAHGRCQHGCFVAAQSYSGATTGSRRVEFAVADSGQGIFAHLRQRSKFSQLPNAERALQRALQPRVTGEEDDTGRGNGLPDLISRGAQYGGRFVLRSDSGFAAVRLRANARVDTYESPCPVQGTWAWVQLDLG